MNPVVPVIAQTACEYRGMRQKCLAAGFDEYISKPIDFDVFMGIIKEHVLHSAGRN
jgi:CheY-like chemotaxis protein